MLSIIKASLMDTIGVSDVMSDGKPDKETLRWMQIKKLLKANEFIMNADVRAIYNVSATANRILAGLVTEGKLSKCREGGHWAYRVVDEWPL